MWDKQDATLMHEKLKGEFQKRPDVAMCTSFHIYFGSIGLDMKVHQKLDCSEIC